ncbi:MAG: hypothetical protein ACOZFS_01255 [Thermodesulfobacteriota bacterium]
MKRAWLILVMMGIVTAPALSLAGTLPNHYPGKFLVKMDDSELARATGQGPARQLSQQSQEGRIVIWDEWACSASKTSKVTKASCAGVGTVNYSQRQATFTATR